MSHELGGRQTVSTFRGEFERAVDAALQGLANTRQIEDFLSIYNDLVLACALAGVDYPTTDYPPYKGPEYIRATAEENEQLFAESS